MKVQVTQEDIDKGCKGSYESCPIALALMRDGMEWAEVGGFWIYSPAGRGDTPQSAQRFMEDFDLGNTVEPFSFDIEFEIEPDATVEAK